MKDNFAREQIRELREELRELNKALSTRKIGFKFCPKCKRETSQLKEYYPEEPHTLHYPDNTKGWRCFMCGSLIDHSHSCQETHLLSKRTNLNDS